jgi:hypothetical protein
MGLRNVIAGILGLGLGALAMHPAASDAAGARERPIIADRRLDVGAGEQAQLPLYLSQDWTRPQPGITRAVVVLHGRRRNAHGYWRTARAALARSGLPRTGVLLIVPQFLDDADVLARGLPPPVLHWSAGGWMAGLPAHGPRPLSSFDALDAIMARLADRGLLPGLRQVVIAGHSAGGQLAQRYAVLGRGPALLQKAGIGLRFVLANPSSYAYFDVHRPVPVDPLACPGFDRWKYGLQDLPPYAGRPVPGADALAAAYATRRIIYLLGGADTDPQQAALDRRCAASAQGPDRLARGLAYAKAILLAHPDAPQRVVQVPGVAHDGRAMFTSAQGLAALFAGPADP